MTKYKQYFQEMLSGNQAVFDDFKKIHDQFALDRMKYQDEFKDEVKKVYPKIDLVGVKLSFAA